jgi:hypothetical protein
MDTDACRCTKDGEATFTGVALRRVFRPIFAFAFIDLATRRTMFEATTRFPSHAWMTQWLRNAIASRRLPNARRRSRPKFRGSYRRTPCICNGARWSTPGIPDAGGRSWLGMSLAWARLVTRKERIP